MFRRKNTNDICNLITKDKAKLLEIGCGPGNITKYLLSKRTDFNIFGIDTSGFVRLFFKEELLPGTPFNPVDRHDNSNMNRAISVEQT